VTVRLLRSGDPRLEASDDLATAREQVADADLPSDQDSVRARLLELIGAHRDAADRSCRPGHLTGSALVVDAVGERTLLMLHRKLGRWFQPGGHADGNTNLAAVALEEATEETGISGLAVAVPAFDVDVHRVDPPAEDPHLHFDLRHLVVAPPEATEQANEESLALRWVTEGELDELDPTVDPSTRRLVVRGLALARRL
jgi:8-oxo-dGTP pyrophosphatase MutT (NUDIX family)